MPSVVDRSNAPSVAVFAAAGIGDGLILATLCHNLALNGFRTVLYSTPLYPLRDWFSSFSIQPYPEREKWHEECTRYTLAYVENGFVHWQENPLPKDFAYSHVRRLNTWQMDKSKTFVDNLLDECRQQMPLSLVCRHNGICAPGDHLYRRFERRIIIHPASTEKFRSWPVGKYLGVAEKLALKGYEPHFIVSPAERMLYQQIEDRGWKLWAFPLLSELACFLYESGYLVGNDSGPGHLASCLGIPTVTLFGYAGNAAFWRPAWSPGRILKIPPYVPSRWLRHKLWKRCITEGMVLRAFKALIDEN